MVTFDLVGPRFDSWWYFVLRKVGEYYLSD